MQLEESTLIHDWNRQGAEPVIECSDIELDDETLRDGLQSPSVRIPSIEDKLRILHLMVDLGIDGADLGLPAAGGRSYDDVLRLSQEIVNQRLPIVPNVAARTLVADIEPIAEISQKAGIALEVAAFIGSSPIRLYTESWDIDLLLRMTHTAVSYCTAQGLPVMYVTEDTTRADPEDLRRLYTTAVEAGARRVCIADTVGHATPAGAKALVKFVRQVVADTGETIKVDWHGHRDRGLGVANALAAAEAGAVRLHGTGLGIGERVGNTAMDLLLVNLQLLGWIDRDLSCLAEYCRLIADSTGVSFPENYPALGADAFRTQTGVHAAAILKARSKGDTWLADRIYSGVPAAMVGSSQRVEVGPMSGESNVHCWLKEHGYPCDAALVRAIFERAKVSAMVLSTTELRQLCHQHGASPAA